MTADIRPWRHISEIPLTLGDDYVLDVLPTDREAAVLRRLRDGDRIVTSQRGDGFAWERAPDKPRKYLVVALIDNHWISPPCPDGQLFGELTDGTLNLRGSYALRRFETNR